MLIDRAARVFLLMLVVCLVALAGLAVAIGPNAQRRYETIGGCSIPSSQSATSSGAPFTPEFQPFDDVEPAEQFVCHRVPYARELHGWKLQGIDAMRLNAVFNGKQLSSWSLNFRYTLGTYSTPSAHYMTVFASVGFLNDPRRPRAHFEDGVLKLDKQKAVDFSVGAEPAQLIIQDKSPPDIVWRLHGVNLGAMLQPNDDAPPLTMADLLPLLRSIR